MQRENPAGILIFHMIVCKTATIREGEPIVSSVGHCKIGQLMFWHHAQIKLKRLGIRAEDSPELILVW